MIVRIKMMVKKGIILLITALALFLSYKYAVTNAYYFFLFILFLLGFAMFQFFIAKYLENKKIGKNTFAKHLDWLWSLIFGFLLYLFFSYIYPGK